MTDRLIEYGISIVRMEPDDRINLIDLPAAKKALKHLIKETRFAQKQISDPAFTKKWRAASKDRNEKYSSEMDERAEERRERAAYLRTPEGKAELAKERAEKRRQRDAKEDVQRTANKEGYAKVSKAIKVAGVFESLYDTLKLAGKPIGDVHYRELHELRHKGVFEASMCDQILRYARPNNNVKIRDIVTEDRLRQFGEIASQAAQRIARDGFVTERRWSLA